MILEVQGIDTFYGETQALYGVSLGVARGEVLALLGANGAGKTTAIRSILGLTRPRRGTIRFDGREITHTATHEIARGGICWVPDDRRLCPTLTVAKNLRIATKSTPFRGWTLKETFEIFSPLEYLMDRDAENLSRLARIGAVRRTEPGARAENRFRCSGDGAPTEGRGRRVAGRRAERRDRAVGRGQGGRARSRHRRVVG
jgi:ABC-type branched-subunit amino acid transport system ATPase component